MTIPPRICYALQRFCFYDSITMSPYNSKEPLITSINWNGYYTIVLDIEKYHRWFKARKKNFPGLTHTKVVTEIGYKKAHFCKQLNQHKYDVKPGPRFIATFLKTYGLYFEEIFKIIPDNSDEWYPQQKPYIAMTNFRRHDENRMPHTRFSR